MIRLDLEKVNIPETNKKKKTFKRNQGCVLQQTMDEVESLLKCSAVTSKCSDMKSSCTPYVF